MKIIYLVFFLFLLGCSKPDYDENGCFYLGYIHNVEEYNLYRNINQFSLTFSDSVSSETRIYKQETLEHFWVENNFYSSCGQMKYEVYRYIFSTDDKKHKIEFLRTALFDEGKDRCNTCFISYPGGIGQRDLIVIDSIKIGFGSISYNNHFDIGANFYNSVNKDTVTIYLNNIYQFKKLEWKSKKLKWETSL